MQTAASDNGQGAGGEFRLSRWTIRLKLMLIISGIILASLMLMIFLASAFFRSDSQLRVEENNLKLNSVIASNIQSSISAINRNALVVARILDKSPALESELENTMFQVDPNLIYLGVYRRSGEGLSAGRQLINPEFLVENQLLRTDIYSITPRHTQTFLRSTGGQTTMVNASPGFEVPLVGLSFPYTEGGDSNRILVAYLKMDFFIDAFKSEGGGLVTTFMVALDDGTVVAHNDEDLVLPGASFAELPIVEELRTSDKNNGQFPYSDEGEAHLGAFCKLEFAGLGSISTAKEAEVFAEVYNIQRRNIYLMIVIISAAILFVFFFARSLVQPILRLVTAARMIRDGQYDIDMDPAHADEVGLLTDSFNSMSRGLQERENLKVSFGKFVNKELAEMSLSGELPLGGSKKDVAVFFSDIRSFTAISEKLRPEEVVEFLNEYFHHMVGCVNQTHGTVDKFIGDALMATWGTFREHGNEAENAINSALMMREALKEYNKGRGGARKPIIKMGAGINYGPVIAGQIGSDEKMEFTVIGDTVNLASRVESLTKHFGADLLITQFALDKVKGLYNVEQMDAMRVKGKSKPVKVYAVLGRKDDPSCPKNMSELRKRYNIDYDASKAGKPAGEEVKYESVK